jgi:hypothetical protein
MLVVAISIGMFVGRVAAVAVAIAMVAPAAAAATAAAPRLAVAIALMLLAAMLVPGLRGLRQCLDAAVDRKRLVVAGIAAGGFGRSFG